MRIINEAALEKAELLAKLSVEPEKRTKTMAEMEKLFGYVEKLKEVNTEGVEPLTHTSDTKKENRFRRDEVTNPDGKEGTLFNAPVKKDGQFAVPKTV